MEIEATILVALLRLVRKHTGITMTERKSILLQGRLQPRLRALSLRSYQEYLDLLAQDQAEVQLFINMVTTNDTVFFRTPQVWDFFSGQFLPEWRRHHPGQRLKVWSAAAASGEEAYSIAMLCEEFRQHALDFQYQILATDISTKVLSTAQEGLYCGRSIDKLKTTRAKLLEKYFLPEAGGLRVVAELKSHICFAAHNLLQQLQSTDRFDIVFLRNALIYFDAENQERIVNQTREVMKDNAKLILGESESLSPLKTDYRYEMPMVYSVSTVTA